MITAHYTDVGRQYITRSDKPGAMIPVNHRWAAELKELGVVIEEMQGPTLEEAKAALWDTVKQRRAEASAVVLFDGHAYQTDLGSRTNLDGARDLLASGAISEISWTTADNVEIVHDAAGLEALWLAGAAHIATCFDRAKALRVEIDAAPDHAALDAIDIEANWP